METTADATSPRKRAHEPKPMRVMTGTDGDGEEGGSPGPTMMGKDKFTESRLRERIHQHAHVRLGRSRTSRPSWLSTIETVCENTMIHLINPSKSVTIAYTRCRH